MTVDDRLLIPLDVLPGPLPAGAPVYSQTWRHGVAVQRDDGVQMVRGPDGMNRWIEGLDPARSSASERVRYAFALDLTPPETGAAGFPLRIDGLDVAVGMLARAMGMDDGVRWLDWNESATVRGWCVDTHAYEAFFLPVSSTRPNRYHVPALANIDPTDPLAPRLAIAAIMRAKPWSKP